MRGLGVALIGKPNATPENLSEPESNIRIQGVENSCTEMISNACAVESAGGSPNNMPVTTHDIECSMPQTEELTQNEGPSWCKGGGVYEKNNSWVKIRRENDAQLTPKRRGQASVVSKRGQ